MHFGSHTNRCFILPSMSYAETLPLTRLRSLLTERLLLGVGPLVSLQRGVMVELLRAEITAVGLLAHVGLLVNTQVPRLHEPLDSRSLLLPGRER